MNGIGGCANVGGTCIGCTMPGFPDKFQPFLDEPPGAKMSSSAVLLYGRTVRALRNVTRASMNVEPEWRGPLPKGLRPAADADADGRVSDTGPHLVDKTWDPITRIVGSLGIHARIDFRDRKVVRCHSTSSIFRGYSVFMRGKDPRDAHQITSRICGICGDNHATASVYAQNMAYGVKPPHLAEWIINLAEAAEYMFDHNLYQENLVGVDFCARMVGETNPGVLARAEVTEAPHADVHGYRTIADIMRAFNPMEGALYLEALKMSRLTREMFCLMEGRHVHPSLLYPGGVGTVPSVQLLRRLPRPAGEVRRAPQAHGAPARRPVRLHVRGPARLRGGGPAAGAARLVGLVPGPRDVRLPLRPHGLVGTRHVRDARASWSTASWSPPTWSRSTSGCGSCSAARSTTTGPDGETFVTHDPLGNPVDQRHPWNQTTLPRPQRRDLEPGQLHVGHVAPVARPPHRRAPGPRHRRRPPGPAVGHRPGRPGVDTPYVDAPGDGSVRIRLPRTAHLPETEFEWRVPQWSNTIERDRARTYFQAYSAAMAFHFLEQAMAEVDAGRLEVWTPFEVPDEAVSCGFHEAVRGVLSHHMVIRKGRIANYHPYPPTCWNASPRDSFGTAGPYEDAVEGSPVFEENGPDELQGHRHHAHGPQLRPLPALRRAHVSRPGEGAPGPPRAYARPPVSARHPRRRAPDRRRRPGAAAGRPGGGRRRGPRGDAPAGRGGLPRRTDVGIGDPGRGPVAGRAAGGRRARSASTDVAAVSERDRLAAHVRRSEARFRSLVEQLPAVVFSAALGEDDNEVYVSPHIETVLGFTQKEWLSNPLLWYSQLHPDDHDVVIDAFTRGVQTGEPFRAEVRFMSRTGEEVWILGEARLIRDDAGRLAYFQGVGLRHHAHQAGPGDDGGGGPAAGRDLRRPQRGAGRAQRAAQRRHRAGGGGRGPAAAAPRPGAGGGRAPHPASTATRTTSCRASATSCARPSPACSATWRCSATATPGPSTPSRQQMLEVIHRNSRRLLSRIEDLLTVSGLEAGKMRLTLAPRVGARAWSSRPSPP